jgi:hypothetical protein
MPNAEMLKTIIQQILKVKQSPMLHWMWDTKNPFQGYSPWNNTGQKNFFDEEPGDKADLKHGTGMKSHRTMMMKTYRKGSKRMLIAP